MLRDFNSKNHPGLQAAVFSLKVTLLIALLAFVWQFGFKDDGHVFAGGGMSSAMLQNHMAFIYTIVVFAVLALLAPTYTLYRYIVRRDRAEAQIKHMATHDTLTNIPNRNLFFDRLERAMANAHRQKEKLAVLFIDLDNFKAVNDRLGHDAGDHILKTTAKRLVTLLRGSDTVARFGGDEFVAILTNIKDIDIITDVVHKLKREIKVPTTFEQKAISVGVSIGLAVYPDHGTNGDQLIGMADRNMYTDKGYSQMAPPTFLPIGPIKIAAQDRCLNKIDA